MKVTDGAPISPVPNQTEPREPYWHLFLDDHSITRSTGFRRVVHPPQPRGVVLRADKPWETEGNTPVYVGRRKDGMLECYYRAHWWITEPAAQGPPRYEHPDFRNHTAYAVSEDGVHWEKPVLKLVEGPSEIDGDTCPPYRFGRGKSNLNNLVPCNQPRDLRLYGNVRDPAKRFTLHYRGNPAPVCFASEPPDFMNDPDWREKLVDSGGFQPSHYNTLEFWDDLHEEWVAMRQAPNHPPVRCAGRYASPDLQNWTLEHFLYPDAHDSTDPRSFDEVYGLMAIHIEGFVVGFALWFHGDDTHPSNQDCGLIGTNTGKGPQDVRIVTSWDGGRTWDRTVSREAWIPHGTEEDSYDRYVRLDCPPLRMGDEDWFYCSAYNGDHLSARRYYRDRITVIQGALYVQKHNRYASLTAGNRHQILITQPIEVTGKTLQLNVDASRGEVKVAVGIDKVIEHRDGAWKFKAKLPHWMVEDRWGQTHLEEGFHFDDCEPVHANSIEYDVKFKDSEFESLRGKTVRLYISVQDADLYGFRFR